MLALAVIGGSMFIVGKSNEAKKLRNTAVSNYEMNQVLYIMAQQLASSPNCNATFGLPQAQAALVATANNDLRNATGGTLFNLGDTFGSTTRGVEVQNLVVANKTGFSSDF